MEIESIINNIDSILNYFLPGYLYMRTKSYCTGFKLEIDNIGKIFDGIFISIILEKTLDIIPLFLGATGIFIRFTAKHNKILTLSCIAILLGYISSRKDFYEFKNYIMGKLRIKKIDVTR